MGTSSTTAVVGGGRAFPRGEECSASRRPGIPTSGSARGHGETVAALEAPSCLPLSDSRASGASGADGSRCASRHRGLFRQSSSHHSSVISDHCVRALPTTPHVHYGATREAWWLVGKSARMLAVVHYLWRCHYVRASPHLRAYMRWRLHRRVAHVAARDNTQFGLMGGWA